MAPSYASEASVSVGATPSEIASLCGGSSIASTSSSYHGVMSGRTSVDDARAELARPRWGDMDEPDDDELDVSETLDEGASQEAGATSSGRRRRRRRGRRSSAAVAMMNGAMGGSMDLAELEEEEEQRLAERSREEPAVVTLMDLGLLIKPQQKVRIPLEPIFEPMNRDASSPSSPCKAQFSEGGIVGTSPFSSPFNAANKDAARPDGAIDMPQSYLPAAFSYDSYATPQTTAGWQGNGEHDAYSSYHAQDYVGMPAMQATAHASLPFSYGERLAPAQPQPGHHYAAAQPMHGSFGMQAAHQPLQSPSFYGACHSSPVTPATSSSDHHMDRWCHSSSPGTPAQATTSSSEHVDHMSAWMQANIVVPSMMSMAVSQAELQAAAPEVYED